MGEGKGPTRKRQIKVVAIIPLARSFSNTSLITSGLNFQLSHVHQSPKFYSNCIHFKLHGVPSEKADSKRLSFLTVQFKRDFFWIIWLLQGVNLIKCPNFSHGTVLDNFLTGGMSSHFSPTKPQ